MIIWSKKRNALFQTHIGKSKVFSTNSYVYLYGYTQIRAMGQKGLREKILKYTNSLKIENSLFIFMKLINQRTCTLR